MLCIAPRLIVKHGNLWALSCQGNENVGKQLGQIARQSTWRAASHEYARKGKDVVQPARAMQAAIKLQHGQAVRGALVKQNGGTSEKLWAKKRCRPSSGSSVERDRAA